MVPPPDASGPATLSFEGALARLEAIVDDLERGELPLEEALAAFEEGIGLSRRCAETLDAAERRIEMLAGEDGGLRPFESGPAEGGDASEDADT